MQQPETITPAFLRSWRISVGWTMERTAAELGFAQSTSIFRWESGHTEIPYTAQVALRWLIHITPEKPPTIAPPVRKLASSRRPWLASELSMLATMDTTPPGSILEMAIKLGRSQKSVITAIVKLRKAGVMPRDNRWRHRKRGPKSKRIAASAVTPPASAPRPTPSIMGDDFKKMPPPKPGDWRAIIQGPRR